MLQTPNGSTTLPKSGFCFPPEFATIGGENPLPAVNYVNPHQMKEMIAKYPNGIKIGQGNYISSYTSNKSDGLKFKFIDRSRIVHEYDYDIVEAIEDCYKAGLNPPTGRPHVFRQLLKRIGLRKSSSIMRFHQPYVNHWEFMPHGNILLAPGHVAYEYDIHRAYPTAMSSLPRWRHTQEEIIEFMDDGMYVIESARYSGPNLPEDPAQHHSLRSGRFIKTMLKDVKVGPMWFIPVGKQDFTPIYDFINAHFRNPKRYLSCAWSIFAPPSEPFSQSVIRDGKEVKSARVFMGGEIINYNSVIWIQERVKLKIYEAYKAYSAYRIYIDSITTPVPMGVPQEKTLGEFSFKRTLVGPTAITIQGAANDEVRRSHPARDQRNQAEDGYQHDVD